MAKKSVLIVDDEKNIRLTLTHCLNSYGFDTDTAINGEEAFRKLEERAFDVILLDLVMPGMSGIEFLEKLRERGDHTHVVIVTAHGNIETAVKAMKLGAVDYIQKPFAPNEIREIVETVTDDSRSALHTTYMKEIALAKKCIERKDYQSAIHHVKTAITLDPTQAEVFNLLGVLMEMKGERQIAANNYHAAFMLDPTCSQAIENYNRLTQNGEP